jgi:hypothetical protein
MCCPLAGEELLEEEWELPSWYRSFAAEGSIGYRDNVTLRHSLREESGFWRTAAEILTFRLPKEGWQLNAFGSFEDIRYFDAPSVEDEQLGTAFLQAGKSLGRGWESGFLLNYLFQDQFFDLSANYADTNSIGQVVGHYISPRLLLKKRWNEWKAESELQGTRQFLEEPFDSYWQPGLRLLGGVEYRSNSELTLAYTCSRLLYDDRVQASLAGEPMPSFPLEMTVHFVELAWTHTIDSEGRLRVTASVGYEDNSDNGSGFYDYEVLRTSASLRYRIKGWEILGRTRVGVYDFDEQKTGGAGSENRERQLFTASFRLEKRFAKHWMLHASYAFDRSFSNLEFDDYTSNTVMGGLGLEF